MKVPVVTAVTDAARESALVEAFAAPGTGVEVVRRCADLSDLLATAAAGGARAALLSADLRRLDRDALTRLAAARVAVVALVPADDEAAERRVRQLGVATVLPADADPSDVARALREQGTAGVPLPSAALLSDPAAALPAPPGEARHALPDPGVDAPPVAGAPEPGTGQVVAVWGPHGAPGRTSVAVGLADEAARAGVSTLLVDADTYGGAVAQVLGLLEEAAGVAAACRASGAGTLDVPRLAALARTAAPQLRVLTGIVRTDRWPEVRPVDLTGVLDVARSLAAVTVVDCGFSLEADEELSFDTAAPRRNGATLAALEAADVVVAVGGGDPLGLQRLVRGLEQLGEVVPDAVPRVVLTRARPAVVGSRDPAGELRAALHRFAGLSDVAVVPDDRGAYDAALAAGRTLAEVAPRSPARAALRDLAATCGLLGDAGRGAATRRGSRLLRR